MRTVTLEHGGPAFPFTRPAEGGGTFYAPGMTMRDWFAGQALAGQLAFSPVDPFEKAHQPDEVAQLAYRFADAMLAAREGR